MTPYVRVGIANRWVPQVRFEASPGEGRTPIFFAIWPCGSGSGAPGVVGALDHLQRPDFWVTVAAGVPTAAEATA